MMDYLYSDEPTNAGRRAMESFLIMDGAIRRVVVDNYNADYYNFQGKLVGHIDLRILQ